jgi:hypothetical protein
VTAREGTSTRPGESTLTQYTEPESNNPYSASCLDSRVDPRAKNSNTGSASAITGAFATSKKSLRIVCIVVTDPPQTAEG